MKTPAELRLKSGRGLDKLDAPLASGSRRAKASDGAAGTSAQGGRGLSGVGSRFEVLRLSVGLRFADRGSKFRFQSSESQSI